MHALPNASSRTYVVPASAPSLALGDALQHGLSLPLLALRASMESLHEALAHDGEPTFLDGALREVVRLGKNVQDLLDFSRVPVAMALACTLEEIASNARRLLDADQRERLIVAEPARALPLCVDGPLLSIALHRLLANAFEAGSEQVLLAIEQTFRETRFSVVDASNQGFDASWAQEPFHTTKLSRLGLGLALVRLDVAVLGGTFALEQTERRGTCAAILLPTAAAQGEALR